MASIRKFRKGATAVALPVMAVTLGLLASAAHAQNTGASLHILSPKAGESLGAAPFKIDVSFDANTKTPVTAVELWCDGARWVRRDLDAPQTKNVLTFDVDASALAAGTHNFTVKLFTVGGGISTAPLKIVAGTDSGISTSALDSNIRLSFLAPLNGKKVAGNVELNLDVKTANGANPYVTFYVDKQFKTLKNYPPYSYIWDTTTSDNGYHLIEATAYTEAANQAVGKRIKVYVDNPGGNTRRNNNLPDLSVKGTVSPTESLNPLGAATLTMPLVKRIAVVKPNIVSPARFSFAAPTALKTQRIASVGIAKIVGSTTSRAADEPILPSVTTVTLPAVRPTKIALSPSLHAVKMVKPLTLPKFSAMATGTPHPMVLPAKTMVEVKPLQIAFDGERIAFDVAPRVEAGMPLAPFRQIFEHTGGQLTWVSETKVVRAVNADREVIIGVGKKEARVNGENINMERAAFIERGRTIVPLSFVGKALDVKVQFDAATGRLQITSLK